ncbi:MAG TPA: metalloregulator ArsR/SmtB family transcription factor [Paenirhodobacter sp.]
MTVVSDLADGQAETLRANANAASFFLKRLSNPDRLQICCALVEGEVSVRALEERLSIRQPGLSQQIAALRAAGMIEGRKDGRHIYYRLADPRVVDFIATLHRLFCAPSGAA